MRRLARAIAFCARGLAIGLLALVVSGCSRTVSWEEEVLLNTGETIWIEREMTWAMLGAMGNPFDIGLRPTREQVIRFKYGARQYQYVGRAHVHWLAISPSKVPVLVAPAADFGWYSKHNYYCVVPYYVQFIPDASGKQWTWPEKIEPWLYNLPANVMTSLPVPGEGRRRFTNRDRDQRDHVYRLQVPEGARIDPYYKVSGCLTSMEELLKRNHNRSNE